MQTIVLKNSHRKRELNKFTAQLENEPADGTVSTRQEKQEPARLTALEAAKLKTLRQYATSVYMSTKTATFSENSRQRSLDVDITPAMISKLLLDFRRTHAKVKRRILSEYTPAPMRKAYGGPVRARDTLKAQG